jgi:hypothetical protein
MVAQLFRENGSKPDPNGKHEREPDEEEIHEKQEARPTDVP